MSRLGVQCVIASNALDYLAFQRDLCSRLAALAGDGAPVPVAVIEPGDPALLEAGTLTLILHGSLHAATDVTPRVTGRLLTFTVRPYRAASDDAVLFGTAPQVVSLPAGADEAPLDAALNSALAQMLPWRARQDGPNVTKYY